MHSNPRVGKKDAIFLGVGALCGEERILWFNIRIQRSGRLFYGVIKKWYAKEFLRSKQVVRKRNSRNYRLLQFIVGESRTGKRKIYFNGNGNR